MEHKKLKINRIKKIVRYFLFCFLFYTIFSCSDYLEVDPESSINIDNFYSNKTEVDIALAGIYSIYASNEMYGNALSIIMTSGTDEGYYNRRFNENWTVGLYRHTPSDGFVQDLWTQCYEIINLANLFTEQLKVENFTEEEANALLGEARFLRAQAYAILANWYGEVPLSLSSTKDQSANSLAPSSLEVVYEQIIEDFTFATIHLQNIDAPEYVSGRANKNAAHGLLARVYLKMATFPLKDTSKFQLARAQCDSIIQSGLHSLTPSIFIEVPDGEGGMKPFVTQDGYRRHFLSYIQSNYDPQESIFEISFRQLRDLGLIADGRLGDANGIPFGFGGGLPGNPTAFAGFNTTTILKQSYEDNNDSIRKVWNIPEFEYTGQGDAKPIGNSLTRSFTPGKYRRWEPSNFDDLATTPAEGEQEPFTILENGSIIRNFTNINFPILRYSDVLLMYAEADNEINDGPTALAIQYLDEVRNRAGLYAISVAKPAAISDKESFFNEVVDERFRELCFEGLRKQDLIRWELLDDKLEDLENAIINNPVYSPTNADHQAFLRPSRFFDINRHLSLPYPLQEVQLNDKLDQKSNW